MSSFLDSTGLDRLATKLKAYFMKKPTSASTSSYPLTCYDATNNVGKYNSDITLNMAQKWISALSNGVYQEYDLGITTDSVSDDLNSYNDPISSAGITVLRIGGNVKDNVQNKPVDSGGCCVVVSNAGGFAHQLYFATNGSNTVYMRERYSGRWTNWTSLRDASWINSGTFNTARIPTSSSVTKNDTTHVPTADAVWNRAYSNSIALSKGKTVIKLGTVSFTSVSGSVIRFCVWNDGYADAGYIIELYVTYQPGGTHAGIQSNCIASHSYIGSTGQYSYEVYVDANGSSADVYFKITSSTTNRKTINLIDYDNKFTPNVSELDSVPTTATSVTVVHPVKIPSSSAVGSSSQSVYVDSNGEVKPCYVVRRYSSWANSVRFTKSLSTAWNDGQSVVITSAAWRHHKTMFSVSFVISGTITESNPLGTEGSVRIVRMNNNIGNPPNIYYRVTNGEVEFVIHGMNGLTTNCAIYVDEYGISTTLSADWSSSGYSLITNPTRLTANFTTF